MRGMISIHAPLAGSDCCHLALESLGIRFQSTLPLRGATTPTSLRTTRKIFQSTLPLRGATRAEAVHAFNCAFQSTLPLRGATFPDSRFCVCIIISIHAPLAGSDTRTPATAARSSGISIHAPLAGSDPDFPSLPRRSAYFNPRSPCGERRGQHVE